MTDPTPALKRVADWLMENRGWDTADTVELFEGFAAADAVVIDGWRTEPASEPDDLPPGVERDGDGWVLRPGNPVPEGWEPDGWMPWWSGEVAGKAMARDAHIRPATHHDAECNEDHHPDAYCNPEAPDVTDHTDPAPDLMQALTDSFAEAKADRVVGQLVRGAEAVARRLIDNWIADLHGENNNRPGWYPAGVGMNGPSDPFTADEHAWLTFLEGQDTPSTRPVVADPATPTLAGEFRALRDAARPAPDVLLTGTIVTVSSRDVRDHYMVLVHTDEQPPPPWPARGTRVVVTAAPTEGTSQPAHEAPASARREVSIATDDDPSELADPPRSINTAKTLWEILVLTGYDTDGDTGPEALIAGMGWDGYVGVVRDEVKRLREDYDEALDEIP